jgi:CRP-like cAMP-binding protein
MPVPLRLVSNQPVSNPLITRLCGYAALSAEEIAGLDAAFERRLVIKKRRDVILEGYESHRLHIAISGFAARYKLLANGKRQVISIVLPGDIIGMPSAFFRSSLYSVTALSDMTMQVVRLDAFLALCRRMPGLAIAMLWCSQHELATYADHIVDVGRRSPLERVAHFVLEMHARLRAAGCAEDRSFELPLSQEIIGDLLGLSAPHVNRMLHQLKAERLISVDRHQVMINDPEGLQMLAQFEPLSPLAQVGSAH